MEHSKGAFDMLVKPIRRLIEQRGFEAPTEPQEKTIPKILEGKNVLLISPTATGKTEAAVLPVLNMLIQTPEKPPGIKILYITPLRALNRDLLERLEWWCNNLDVKLAVRHGDTETGERARQARSPPDILITTPETLQAILPGWLMRQHLQQVRWVIIDEVHEMADSKRGSQLSLALERLRWITGKDFQVIGLSATIGSPKKVAQFLVGNGRDVEIVKVPVARLMRLKILFPQPTPEDAELASTLFTHPEVAARLRIIRQYIEKQKSVLLFTNTRAISEVLASRFKVWDIDFPVSIHHGSLAKPSRIAAERGLKNGKLRGLVCVSGDSRVLLSNGRWAPIKKLMTHSEGQPSILSLSQLLKIQPAFARSVKETGISQLIQVSAKSGFQLKCTPDHRFLTINKNGELDWVAAQDLTIGLPVALARRFQYIQDPAGFFDFLLDNTYIRISRALMNQLKNALKDKYKTYVNMARFLPFSKENIRSYLSRGKAIPYNRFKLLLQEAGLTFETTYPEIVNVGSKNYARGRIPLHINENVARFIGFLLAEGSISRADMLRLFNTNLPLLQRYAEILKKEFNLSCNMTQSSDGTWCARTHATWLCRILKNMGVKGGRKATKVSIPPIFFSLPSKLVFDFIAGYFDGDGCLEKKDGRIYSALFITFSESMARDLQLILLNQGILSTCRKNEPKELEEHSGYTVAIMGGQHLRNFLENCHLWRNYKLSKSLETSEGYSHRDCIPNMGTPLEFVRKKAGLATYRMRKEYGINPYKYEKNQGAISRKNLGELINIYERFVDIPSIIKLLSNSDIFWDHVSNIEKINTLEPVYDVFDVEGSSNFIVNGFITHNCTSSLELGIDVGRIDMVIQYMSPRQVTRLIQRVGRSGHRIGRIARGLIITMDSDDTLEAMVIARMAYREELEPVDIPQKPYDALAHQIVGLLMKKKRCYFYEIYDLFKNAYPYGDLALEDIQKVLTYMHSRYPRLAWVSFEDMLTIKPRRTKALYEYYFENLSMIPDEKQYLVIDETSNAAVGILDEAFMAEYGKPGVKFIIRGSPWKIMNVYGDKIYVKPVDDPTGAIPSWVGEEIPVPFEVAQGVGWIRGFVEEQMRGGVEPEEVSARLGKKYPADKETILRALLETVEHVRRGCLVPTDKRIVVEDWEDFVIIHANFGSLTNRAIAQLMGHVLSEQTGYTVAVQHDPYRIFIQTMGTANADSIIGLFNEMKQMPESTIRDLLTKATVKTGIFKRRMVHVARRFGALKKWVDFSTVSLRSLMKSFEGTAIYDEALKETFTKDLDLEHAIQVLNRARAGEVEVVRLDTKGAATPIARVGIERVSMKTDLIPPERMRLILVESAKARLLNEVRTFVCTNCWDYLEMVRMKDLPDKPQCPRCGSTALGVLGREEDQIRSLVEKKGERLTKIEQKWQEQALVTARFMSDHGKPAAVALSGRRLKISDVEDILWEEKELTDHFFELVIEAERKALKRRFW